MNKEAAETMALQALAFLAKDEERLAHLLGSSGLTPADLRQNCRDTAFLGGVLDVVLADDATLLAFCNEASLSPATLIEARHALPGAPVFPD